MSAKYPETVSIFPEVSTGLKSESPRCGCQVLSDLWGNSQTCGDITVFYGQRPGPEIFWFGSVGP